MIPTVRGYLNNDTRLLRRLIIIASIIPLVIYILWVFAVIGNIPPHGPNGFDLLLGKGRNANVGDLITLLSVNDKNNFDVWIFYFVTIVSVTTAFLITSLSFYHFLKDLFRYKANSLLQHKVFPILFTFIVPLLLVFIYPNIFIIGLSYVGIGATILFILIPILMIKQMIKARHNFSHAILQNQALLNYLQK